MRRRCDYYYLPFSVSCQDIVYSCRNGSALSRTLDHKRYACTAGTRIHRLYEAVLERRGLPRVQLMLKVAAKTSLSLTARLLHHDAPYHFDEAPHTLIGRYFRRRHPGCLLPRLSSVEGRAPRHSAETLHVGEVFLTG